MLRLSSLAAVALLLGLAVPTSALADDREDPRDPACDLFMGDVDGSDTVDEDDVYAILDFVFHGTRIFDEVADTNGDGEVTLSDAMFLSAYLHQGGPPPRTDVLSGDANGDDSFDWGDFIAVANYLSGDYPDVCRTGADVNRDSQIDIADLMGVYTELSPH